MSAIMLTIFVNAQNNVVLTVTPDTLTKVETEYFVIGPLTNTYSSLAIQTLYTQLGGTSDGTATLQVSLDGTSYSPVIDGTYDEIFFRGDDDTLTINNGDIWNIEIKNPSYPYYRIAAVGTVNDTTLITTKYIYKR